MKALLWREGTGSNYSRGQRALFGELDPVTACFQQLVGKRYPLKAVRTLEKKTKKKRKAEEENYSFQAEPTWEHTALSGTDWILGARCNVYPRGSPLKGGVSTRGETLTKELNLERSDFIFDQIQKAIITSLFDSVLKQHISRSLDLDSTKQHLGISVAVSASWPSASPSLSAIAWNACGLSSAMYHCLFIRHVLICE